MDAMKIVKSKKVGNALGEIQQVPIHVGKFVVILGTWVSINVMKATSIGYHLDGQGNI